MDWQWEIMISTDNTTTTFDSVRKNSVVISLNLYGAKIEKMLANKET